MSTSVTEAGRAAEVGVPAQPGPPEAEAVQAFAGELLGVLNSGMLSLMISVGHRTGLFDVMSGLPAADSTAIAAAAGLDERYVR